MPGSLFAIFSSSLARLSNINSYDNSVKYTREYFVCTVAKNYAQLPICMCMYIILGSCIWKLATWYEKQKSLQFIFIFILSSWGWNKAHDFYLFFKKMIVEL